MLEKRFYAVPPQAFTADGTTNGVVTIAAEACQLFKVGMKVFINALGLQPLQLQIKEIDSNNNIQVGPISGSLNVPGANTGITARTDISAYTVLLGANISSVLQPRPDIDWSEAMRAMYDEEPSVAMRNVVVDECGNRINQTNPFPVNLYPATNIPFSIGMLMLPVIAQNFLLGLSYDQVTSVTTGNEEILTFYSSSVPVTSITIDKLTGGWNISLGGLLEDFLLLEDGNVFELEDGTGGILLEI